MNELLLSIFAKEVDDQREYYRNNHGNYDPAPMVFNLQVESLDDPVKVDSGKEEGDGNRIRPINFKEWIGRGIEEVEYRRESDETEKNAEDRFPCVDVFGAYPGFDPLSGWEEKITYKGRYNGTTGKGVNSGDPNLKHTVRQDIISESRHLGIAKFYINPSGLTGKGGRKEESRQFLTSLPRELFLNQHPKKQEAA